MFLKRVHTHLKGDLLLLYERYLKENQLKGAEYIRDLIRKDLKEKYGLMQMTAIKTPKKIYPEGS